ncbi:MAG: HsdM family class I SAM-dependent methyltransferase, partial [Caldisphaera sp.]
MNLSDNLIKEILDVISHPRKRNLSYNFAAIDVDILGNMYENYLAYIQNRNNLSGGKSHKKEQGIYYTPKFIVDYIIRNTLGVLLKTLPLKKVKDLKIIDPACGSGSFLISSIYLLDDYYKNHIEDYKSYSPSQKLMLIKNNIYGVDLDEKAVEITKLNIYLTILSLSEQTEIVSYSDLLPELRSNIKVADSLMSDWDKLFPNIKFDAIVMNPPYIGEKGHKELFRKLRTGPLRDFYEGKMDIFYFFIHLAINLCRNGGLIGFITTDYYTTATGGTKLRTNIKNKTSVVQIIDFNEFKVFKSALGQHNMITILTKTKNYNKPAKVIIVKKKGYATLDSFYNIINGNDKETEYKDINQNNLFEGFDNQIRLLGSSTSDHESKLEGIFQKMLKDSKRLVDICNVNQGIISGADKVTKKHLSKYKLNSKLGEGIFVLSNKEINDLKLSKSDSEILKPWFKNSDIHKWVTVNKAKEKIIYADKKKNNLEENKIKDHLMKFINILDASSSNSPYLH